MMEAIWLECLSILIQRGVDIEQTSFAHLLKDRSALITNFINDLKFFFSHVGVLDFNNLFKNTVYDSFIFENGQGLGLDMNVDNDWHTTSNTGLVNPYAMLKDHADFDAEVCYVTRSYLTRHGVGPLEEAVKATSYNQCVSLGIPDRGEIAPGKIADLVLVDTNLDPVMTFVNGHLAWQKN